MGVCFMLVTFLDFGLGLWLSAVRVGRDYERGSSKNIGGAQDLRNI